MATLSTLLQQCLNTLLRTEQNSAALVLRLGLGHMIVPHGAQKLLGWFGGYGFAGTMQFFTETMGIPWLFGFLAIVAECAGGLALIAGAFTPLAALGVGTVILVAAWTSHLRHGFFMNWYQNQAGEGVEFRLLACTIVLALVILGGGQASRDARLLHTCAKTPRTERLVAR
jgi:putative oxidoreductase